MKFLVSFVIPTINKYTDTSKTIDSISNQKTMIPYEIIVVLNTEKIDHKPYLNDKRIKLVIEKNKGRSNARNKGWKNAKGQWVAYLDDDVTIDDNWLEEFRPYLEKSIYHVLQGQNYPSKFKSNHLLSKYREQVFLKRFKGSYSSLEGQLFPAPFCNTSACIIRKSALEEISGFDEELDTYEDVDLSRSLWGKNNYFAVCKGASSFVSWNSNSPLLSYIKREFQMGIGAKKIDLKWPNKEVNKLHFRWNRYEFKNILLVLFDLLLVCSFYFGYKYKSLFLKESLASVKPNLNSSIGIFSNGENRLLLSPHLRVLKTTTDFIIVDTRNFAEIRLKLEDQLLTSEQIFNFLQKSFPGKEIQAIGTIVKN